VQLREGRTRPYDAGGADAFDPERSSCRLSKRSGMQQPFADTVHQFAIRWRQFVQQTVDGLHDDTPLRQAGDGAQRTETRFHFDRQANTELWIVLDLLAFSSSGRRASDAATGVSFLRHGTVRRIAAPLIDSVHRVRIDSGEAAADNSCTRDVQIERHEPAGSTKVPRPLSPTIPVRIAWPVW
jgi:hypothetical protein